MMENIQAQFFLHCSTNNNGTWTYGPNIGNCATPLLRKYINIPFRTIGPILFKLGDLPGSLEYRTNSVRLRTNLGMFETRNTNTVKNSHLVTMFYSLNKTHPALLSENVHI